MISWRLWRGLHSKTGDGSVYWHYILVNRRRRLYEQSDRPQPRWMQLSGFGAVAVLFSGIWVVLIPFLPLILLASGTMLGISCAVQVSSAITYERERARYDVASVLPMGSTGASWVIARIIIQQMDLLQRVHTLVGSFVLIFSLGIIGFFLINGLTLATAIIGVTVLVVLYIDFVQSVLTGTILGTGIATISRERLSSTTTSLLAFMMVQFCFYAIVGILCLLILPLIVNNTLALTLLQLGVIVMGREMLLYGLWLWAAIRLDATLDELNSTVKTLS